MKQNTLNPGFLYWQTPSSHWHQKNSGSPETFLSAGLQVLLAVGTGSIASHSITMPFGD